VGHAFLMNAMRNTNDGKVEIFEIHNSGEEFEGKP